MSNNVLCVNLGPLGMASSLLSDLVLLALVFWWAGACPNVMCLDDQLSTGNQQEAIPVEINDSNQHSDTSKCVSSRARVYNLSANI